MSVGVKKPSVVVLIPAKDEEATVGEVVRQVKAELPCEVVVIDDASTDQTIEMARCAGATVLPLALPMGAWVAMQTGMRYAVQQGHDIAVTMDADGQHPAFCIRSLLMPLENGRADVSIGACTERGSAARRFAWFLFRLISRENIQDLTSGFRAYNRAALSLLAARPGTFLDYQDMGVLLLLRQAGLRIVEQPVRMCPRMVGCSRVFHSWWAVGKYMVRTSVLCLAKRLSV